MDDPEDASWYHFGCQELVFVLVPDDIHVKAARDWLKKATLVIVEKPYNRDLVEAQQFQATLAEMVRINGDDKPLTYVVCIDHYLAKIFSFILGRDEDGVKHQLGAIRRIEFSICESGGVEPWRAASLDAGMVYDLFCHVLAQVSPLVKLETFLGQRGCRIAVAQHEGCPIKAESYAWIETDDLRDAQDRRVVLSGTLGKGVGEKDEKYLRLIGEEAELYADFGPRSDNKIKLICGGRSSTLFEIGKGHPEMLDALLCGRFMEQPVGGLIGEDAVEILRILTSIRSRIERQASRMGEQLYPIGSSLEEIQRISIQV